MLNLQISLEQQGRTIFDLNSDEVNNLVLIADNSNGTAGVQAKGILESGYGYHYCNCLDVFDNSGYKSSGKINYDAFNKVNRYGIDVNPNPAKQWTEFNYILPDENTTATIKISDVSGKIINTFTIVGKQGQQIWDTRKIKPGAYFYTFIVSGLTASGKIIISK